MFGRSRTGRILRAESRDEMKNKHDAWDWNEIGKPLVKECEHATGIVVFSWWRFSITRCTWWCGCLQFEWRGRDGITRTFLTLKAAGTK